MTEGFHVVQREIPSRCEGAPYAAKVTVQAHQVFINPTFDIRTSAPIERWGMSHWDMTTAYNPTPDTLRLTLMSPALSPDSVFWVTLCAKTPIRIVDVAIAH
jgi:hypothetical protein